MKDAIGQLIMAGLPGPDLDNGTVELIHRFRICNFIFFRRNLNKGPEQANELTEGIKLVCQDAGVPSPLIAVDQEGGPVQRLAPPFWPSLISNQEVGRSKWPEEVVIEQAKNAAEWLGKIGVNINLAPVLDLAFSHQNEVLAKRCYGPDASITASLGALYIDILQERFIAATAKHFPGIGRIKQDPHLKRPTISAAAETILTEALPFRTAVEANVMAVMTSHISYPAFDKENIATFSRTIANDLLRGEFGFDGVLITDDLEMGGIVEHDLVPEAAIKALNAGHDMLLICHDQELVRKSANAIEEAVRKDILSKELLLQSVERIGKMRSFVKGGGIS